MFYMPFSNVWPPYSCLSLDRDSSLLTFSEETVKRGSSNHSSSQHVNVKIPEVMRHRKPEAFLPPLNSYVASAQINVL